jgi:hypothetical protein
VPRVNKTDRKRPTHDRDAFKPRILELLREGNQLIDVCEILHVGRASIWRWTQSDRAFGAALEDAQVAGLNKKYVAIGGNNDRAYMAGFFDGEGCIRFQRGVVQKSGMRYYFPAVLLSNTNREIIEFINSIWPGFTVTKARNANNPNSRPLYHWQRTGVSAEVFLRDIGPYLRIKNRQATLVSEFLAFVGDRRRTRDRTYEDDARMIDYYVTMTLLNHRGLKPPVIRTD